MKGSLALLGKPSGSGSSIGSLAISSSFISYSSFSTSFSNGSGRGNCGGKPIVLSSPFLPSFNHFIVPSPLSHQPSLVWGCGDLNHSSLESRTLQESKPKRPIFFLKDDKVGGVSESDKARGSGIGVGGRGRKGEDVGAKVGEWPRLSREEATRKAISILSRGGGQDRKEGGGRGRGMGCGHKRGHGVMHKGDDANGQKLVNNVGPEIMNELTEAFVEMSGKVLPSTMEEEYLEALDTNMKIELEPEYLMEFDINPDIDEKPPVPLREALEKMHPFLMAYEGIQSQEEWEVE
ncbi:hypothetical protein Ancab_016252 [Ancistrocladus abbreviatus]